MMKIAFVSQVHAKCTGFVCNIILFRLLVARSLYVNNQKQWKKSGAQPSYDSSYFKSYRVWAKRRKNPQFKQKKKRSEEEAFKTRLKEY